MINKSDYILVTGGKGFIGSHLIDFLITNGYKNVLSMDRNLSQGFMNESCSYVHGDLCDVTSLRNIFNRYPINCIYHFAGNSNVPLSFADPITDFNSNALGTLNLYQESIKSSVKKILFTSSASVYGQPEYVPVDEGHPLNPISNYALSKLYGEKLAIAYNNTSLIQSSVIRVFSSYGPRQPRYILYDLLMKIRQNSKEIKMIGSPSTIRDYIYVKDAAKAFHEVMISDISNGEVFNLSGGHPIKIGDLVNLVCSLLDIKPNIIYSKNSWPGDIREFNGDISKIKSLIGFEPKVNLVEGLKESIKWFFDDYSSVE
jgi:UDP-glucose 4-epimerase